MNTMDMVSGETMKGNFWIAKTWEKQKMIKIN